ncbi:MAG TPA: CehA/McbA family metallohydrolase [Chloroflexota bacterium]|nr:CehA/McbA family metallohydrolase [Chloroflexota bacterium]
MTSDPYQPLDLSAYCNAGIDLLASAGASRVGLQQFHGLPFRVGGGQRAFVAFGPDLNQQPLTIRVDAAAHSVIVAHRLLGSQLMSGGPMGETVAEYIFRLSDGREQRVPIRERFEIADVATWGQEPFLAVADEKNGVRARWTGPWSEAGYRQTESTRGSARAYYLWRWRNPAPDVAIESLEIIPFGRQFLVAGVTLGLTDEEPFVRDGAVPVRIDLKSPELAARPLEGGASSFQIAVDRGIASYAYQLPERSAEEFLADAFAGWGDRQNPTSSPTYAEVAAIPSATVAVKFGDETVDSVRWGDVLSTGAVDTEHLRVQIVEDGRNWVETVVVDDATGQPVPCRVHFRSPQGVPYQPHGHHGHVNSNNDTWHIDVGGDLRLGQISYAYIDGRCQGWLPRGEVLVDVARGFEYEPLRQRITIEPGQRRLELRLRRWTDMNQRRWFSGDTHVHFLSTQGSLREAQAEDLNVVNLLQSQWGSLFTSTEEFIGGPVVSGDGRTVVWANQENRQHMLGHMILLGLKQPVYPWCSDGPNEAELGGTMETTLAAWADACHAQGGTVILPHFPNPNAEPAALVATGRVDAVEMIHCLPYNHLEYYRYLNAGYRLPLVGGTDKMSSGVAVGQYRTYVHIPADEEFTYTNWCRSLKLGRTFLSGGPLLEFSVDGTQIGDTVHLPARGGTVEVSATARSILPVHSLQIVQNGQVVAQTDDSAGTRSLNLKATLPITAHSWLAARVSGPNYAPLPHHDVWSRGVFAHTSPIYVACGEPWAMADPAGLQYMLTLVGGSLDYIRHLSPHRRPGTVTHHHGEADHHAYLERPFLEARALLRARLATIAE